jgi:hypothetical protein
MISAPPRWRRAPPCPSGPVVGSDSAAGGGQGACAWVLIKGAGPKARSCQGAKVASLICKSSQRACAGFQPWGTGKVLPPEQMVVSGMRRAPCRKRQPVTAAMVAGGWPSSRPEAVMCSPSRAQAGLASWVDMPSYMHAHKRTHARTHACTPPKHTHTRACIRTRRRPPCVR